MDVDVYGPLAFPGEKTILSFPDSKTTKPHCETCSCSYKKIEPPKKKYKKIEKIFNHFKNSNFFGHEHIQIVYTHDKFRGEIIIFLLCEKKD